MFHLNLFRSGFALAFLLMLSACSGDDNVSGNSNGDDIVDEPPDVQDVFPNFSFVLNQGEAWEYGWDATETDTIQGSGTSTNSSNGRFRITLGQSLMIAGLEAFPLEISGNPKGADGDDTWDFSPRWKYVAFDGSNLVGSIDSATWETIFNAQTGVWAGGGFFNSFPSEILITASSGVISNDYINQTAIKVGRSSSQDQCETIGGITICGDESYSIVEHEFYEEGVGVLGYRYYNSYSSNGGGFFTSFVDDFNIGLQLSSLRGETVDYEFEIEPNNDPLTNALQLTLPATIIGAGLAEDSYGGPGWIPRELEPNNSFEQAQSIVVGSPFVGRVQAGDSSTTITIPALNDGFYNTPEYTASFEDFVKFTIDSDGFAIVLMQFPDTNADLDFYVFTYDGGTPTIIARGLRDNIAENNYEEYRQLDLTAGTYYVAVDAFNTDSGEAGYTLSIGSSTPADQDRKIVDWYVLTLANSGSIQAAVSGERSLWLMDSAAIDELAYAEAVEDTAILNSPVLPAGQYMLGVTDGIGEYTLQVQEN